MINFFRFCNTLIHIEMEDYVDLLSDTSSSDKTVIVNNEDIDHILKKYSGGEFKLPSTSSSKGSGKNIYNLDEFSDGEFEYEPLENRIKGDDSKNKPCTFNTNNSWQDKFSTNDFCDDSNDFDAVLNRISQLESEQFHNENRQTCSKEIEALISGDILEKPREKPNEKFGNSTNSNNIGSSHGCSGSFEEELSNGFDLRAELEKIKNNIKLDIILSENALPKSDNSSIDLSSEDLTDEPKRKKMRKINSNNKESQRIEKELAKAAKAKEREQKQIEKENQKQLKNALKVVESCVKPDQCIQYLTVNIDEDISSKHYGDAIKAGLKSGGYNYIVSKQLVPNLISFTRKVPTIENMFLKNVHQQEKHYMLVMEVPEFIENIVNSTLTGHIQSLLSMPQIEHLSIALLGLQKYYKYLRDVKNKEFKAAVAEVSNNRNTNIEFKDLPKVQKKKIDQQLVELQIFCKNIYVRPVEKFEDLAVFVQECTKSVAQIPYKLAKAESLQQENEFFTVNNRDCVRVDKDGNGLNRLWNQFLRMFPLASLETAEAVSSVYPTIHSLMEAYKNYEKPEDGERLLQDIPVRRAAGPLGGQRKLGPEFSKKAYRFFSSKENVLL